MVPVDKCDTFYETRPDGGGKYERWTLVTEADGTRYILREYLIARAHWSGAQYTRNTDRIEMESFWGSDYPPAAAKNNLNRLLEGRKE